MRNQKQLRLIQNIWKMQRKMDGDREQVHWNKRQIQQLKVLLCHGIRISWWQRWGRGDFRNFEVVMNGIKL
eukprot:12688897-Ditylum_brightwellii.AAC.1